MCQQTETVVDPTNHEIEFQEFETQFESRMSFLTERRQDIKNIHRFDQLIHQIKEMGNSKETIDLKKELDDVEKDLQKIADIDVLCAEIENTRELLKILKLKVTLQPDSDKLTDLKTIFYETPTENSDPEVLLISALCRSDYEFLNYKMVREIGKISSRSEVRLLLPFLDEDLEKIGSRWNRCVFHPRSPISEQSDFVFIDEPLNSYLDSFRYFYAVNNSQLAQSLVRVIIEYVVNKYITPEWGEKEFWKRVDFVFGSNKVASRVKQCYRDYCCSAHGNFYSKLDVHEVYEELLQLLQAMDVELSD